MAGTDVRQLMVPIALVCSLLGAAILGTWQFSKFSRHLDKVALELTTIAEHASDNTSALRDLVAEIRADRSEHEMRISHLEAQLGVLETHLENHRQMHPDGQLRSDLAHLREIFEEHLRRRR